MKYRALNLQFPLWYRTIDLTEDFSVVVKQNNIEKTYQLKGEKYSDISADGFLKEPVMAKQLEFKLDTGLCCADDTFLCQNDYKKNGSGLQKIYRPGIPGAVF